MEVALIVLFGPQLNTKFVKLNVLCVNCVNACLTVYNKNFLRRSKVKLPSKKCCGKVQLVGLLRLSNHQWGMNPEHFACKHLCWLLEPLRLGWLWISTNDACWLQKSLQAASIGCHLFKVANITKNYFCLSLSAFTADLSPWPPDGATYLDLSQPQMKVKLAN